MALPRVTQDPETGYAYVYLAEPHAGISAECVTFEDFADEAGVEALPSLVLDFDAEGRLVGIEITGDVERVLRPELLAVAESS